MTKRRLLRWSLILVILAAFAVWLEPTRVVWGWLRGEAFYQGRPTSWWAEQLVLWDCQCIGSVGEGAVTSFTVWEQYVCRPKPSSSRIWLSRFVKLADPPWPAVLEGDPASLPVLNELLHFPGPYVPQWAQEGLERIKQPHSERHFSIIYCVREGPPRFAPGYRSNGGYLPRPTRVDGKKTP